MMVMKEKFSMKKAIILPVLFLSFIIIWGCKKEGPKQGSLLIATKKTNGEVIDCKVIAYTKDNHIDQVAEGISGLDMYLKEGTYDIKIDWRGNMKWINDVKVEQGKKFTDTVVFPTGKLLVKSINKDKTPAAASILVVPDRDPDKGLEVSRNEDGYITQLFVLGEKIQIGNSLETVEKILKPEMLRAPVIREKEGMTKYETRFYKVLGANVDITFVKEGATPFKVETIDLDRKVGAGVSGDPIELYPGIYDVKVSHEGADKWQENVEIKDQEEKVIDVVFEQGWIVVKTLNKSEDVKNLPVTIYPAGDRQNPIKSGRVNEKVSIVPGVYDVIIDYKGKSAQILGVKVVDGKTITKKIRL
ncbi:MAG: hypothetical protein D6734_11905 [Candidatus Schekmanbacteria bacterium]|nr:MAG: hypothetical protein D6734_11905 [Candidatus Schekmanbacteria bacterium]